MDPFLGFYFKFAAVPLLPEHGPIRANSSINDLAGLLQVSASPDHLADDPVLVPVASEVVPVRMGILVFVVAA